MSTRKKQDREARRAKRQIASQRDRRQGQAEPEPQGRYSRTPTSYRTALGLAEGRDHPHPAGGDIPESPPVSGVSNAPLATPAPVKFRTSPDDGQPVTVEE